MLIKVKVFPQANKSEIIKVGDDRFEVYVKAKPIKGLANREVVEVLAGYFKVPLEKVRLLRGFKQRNKIFEI